jgi:hypothetical protein
VLPRQTQERAKSLVALSFMGTCHTFSALRARDLQAEKRLEAFGRKQRPEKHKARLRDHGRFQMVVRVKEKWHLHLEILSVGRTQTVILDVVRAEAFSRFRVNNMKLESKLWYVAGAEQTGVHLLSLRLRRLACMVRSRPVRCEVEEGSERETEDPDYFGTPPLTTYG